MFTCWCINFMLWENKFAEGKVTTMFLKFLISTLLKNFKVCIWSCKHVAFYDKTRKISVMSQTRIYSNTFSFNIPVSIDVLSGIPNAWFLSRWNTLPDTTVHCGIEMSTCTLTVHFALLQNLLKLLIIGRF